MEHDLTVVEQSEYDFGVNEPAGPYLDRVAKQINNPIRAQSVFEAERKINNRLGDQGKIRRLDLVGHGSSGLLSMGIGESGFIVQGQYVSSSGYSFNPLERLKKRFSRDGCVRLLGCHVACGPWGRRLLYALSQDLGVPVWGSLAALQDVHFDAQGFCLRKPGVLDVFGLDRCLCSAPDPTLEAHIKVEGMPDTLEAATGSPLADHERAPVRLRSMAMAMRGESPVLLTPTETSNLWAAYEKETKDGRHLLTRPDFQLFVQTSDGERQWQVIGGGRLLVINRRFAHHLRPEKAADLDAFLTRYR